jgi:hypothetical protein
VPHRPGLFPSGQNGTRLRRPHGEDQGSFGARDVAITPSEQCLQTNGRVKTTPSVVKPYRHARSRFEVAVPYSSYRRGPPLATLFFPRLSDLKRAPMSLLLNATNNFVIPNRQLDNSIYNRARALAASHSTPQWLKAIYRQSGISHNASRVDSKPGIPSSLPASIGPWIRRAYFA